jgi:hypothetical protein
LDILSTIVSPAGNPQPPVGFNGTANGEALLLQAKEN